MKNLCIFVKSNSSLLTETELFPITDAFSSAGFYFDEVYYIYRVDAERLKASLSGWMKSYDNIALVTHREGLGWTKSLAQSVFEKEEQISAQGESIFNQEKTTLFILGADDIGVSYVKNVGVSFLNSKYATRCERMVLRCVGANAEHIQRLLSSARRISGSHLAYNHQRKYDEDVIEIVYDANTPKMLTDDVLRMFAQGLTDSLYALEDVRLEEQLVRLLKLRGKKLSVAESFTGGGVGQRIVSVSGASEVYFEGLNTYNEMSKMTRLGVSEYTLKSYGAVSDQTAYEMAAGLIATENCDISIATTGLAGPKSDRSELPVGLCYIAIGTKERVMVYRYKFDGSRKDITQKAINYALFLAYCHLKNM